MRWAPVGATGCSAGAGSGTLSWEGRSGAATRGDPCHADPCAAGHGLYWTHCDALRRSSVQGASWYNSCCFVSRDALVLRPRCRRLAAKRRFEGHTHRGVVASRPGGTSGARPRGHRGYTAGLHPVPPVSGVRCSEPNQSPREVLVRAMPCPAGRALARTVRVSPYFRHGASRRPHGQRTYCRHPERHVSVVPQRRHEEDRRRSTESAYSTRIAPRAACARSAIPTRHTARRSNGRRLPR